MGLTARRPQNKPFAFSVRRGANPVNRGAGDRRPPGGVDVRLTPTEWSFLELLARNVGRLVTREQVLREVWGPADEHETHYLRVYASQLRRKLQADPSHPVHLMTTAWLGYPLEP